MAAQPSKAGVRLTDLTPFRELTFSGVIGDVGSLDTLQVSWNFGDGPSTPFQAAARGTVTMAHQYAAAGTYPVTLSVRDQNGAQTNVSGTVTVAANGLGTDPWDATKTALVINGTNVGDNIKVAPSGTTTYQVTLNGVSTIFAKPTGHIIVHGWGGGDVIAIDRTITLPTILFGDADGDNLTGGAGPNLLLGGADNGDNLTGGAARDILIGGSGGDNLTGNGGDDLLIAGTTAYDTTLSALCAVTAEWLRTDQTYSQRVSHLLTGGGLNGTTLLTATTVFDDAAGDNLSGNTGTDWFFAKLTAPAPDKVSSEAGETLATPGALPALLVVEGGARAEDGSLAAVTAPHVSPIVEAAKAQWIAAGLTTDQTAALAAVEIQIADLEGATIGLTNGTRVLIDRTAAGHGWFIDPTPARNEEFVAGSSSVIRHWSFGPDPLTSALASTWQLQAAPGSAAEGRMDLLTTVMHELGHVLGYGDQQPTNPTHATLMSEALPTGVRRLPGALEVTGGSSFVNRQALVESETSHENLIDRLLSGSRSAFAGLWGATGAGQGTSSRPDAAVPVIDWREDEERGDSDEQTRLKTVSSKFFWLPRFLLHTGREAVKSHDHGIEVVLPGKK